MSPLKKKPKNFNASQHYHQCNYFAQRRQNVFFVSKNSSKSAAYPPCFLLLFVFMLSAAATGGCKDRVLSGSGLRSVLAPSPPQPNSKTHHLWREGSKPLRTAQVCDDKIPNPNPAGDVTDNFCVLQFLSSLGLYWHQPGICQLLHQPDCPLHGQQAI